MVVTPEDLRAFALGFTIIWGGLALYLVFLHRLSERLAADLERARGK